MNHEVHVRDLTRNPTSGLSADKRGRYLGLVQAGTTVNGTLGAPKTGIDHLVDLDVTHVQLLPVQDLGSCDHAAVASRPDCYNWGHDPVNYNVRDRPGTVGGPADARVARPPCPRSGRGPRSCRTCRPRRSTPA